MSNWNRSLRINFEIGIEFGVDISISNRSEFVYPEPGLFTSFNQRRPLTKGDLENAINVGRLDESIISK